MHPVYIAKGSSRSRIELTRRGCRSEENYEQRERDTEGVGEKEQERRKEEGNIEEGAGERGKPKEKEKPDSATTCIDRGLCLWIPPVVGRFLSLC